MAERKMKDQSVKWKNTNPFYKSPRFLDCGLGWYIKGAAGGRRREEGITPATLWSQVT
jgi:hypothetical protein